MIPFDFEYYQPHTIKQAVDLFQSLRRKNKSVYYYGGGTEFISRARTQEIHVDAIIDLKHIPECNGVFIKEENIHLGSMVTLSELVDASIYPLLTDICLHIGHRTARNKITLGGNLMSHLAYKEVVLSFLLTNSTLLIGKADGGLRQMSMIEFCRNKFKLPESEFIVQIIVEQKYTQLPFYYYRQTKQSTVNYPIVSVASIKSDNDIRVAFSGITSFPFRGIEIEQILNEESVYSYSGKIQTVLEKMSPKILSDRNASLSFRKHLVEVALSEVIKKWEGVS